VGTAAAGRCSSASGDCILTTAPIVSTETLVAAGSGARHEHIIAAAAAMMP
jgi:hypothetical protein